MQGRLIRTDIVWSLDGWFGLDMSFVVQGARTDTEFQSRLKVMDIDEAGRMR